MNMDIRAINYTLDDELKAHIEQRLRFALDRFEDRVSRVTVHLQDVNGPRGGVDQECRVTVALKPRGGVRVRGTDRDPFTLTTRAARRIGQVVGRALDRRRRVHA